MKQNNEEYPVWYWRDGLHDAHITDITVKRSGWNAADNCLIIKLDSDGAMFAQDITELRFYGFAVKSKNFDLELLVNSWWLHDDIFKKADRYLLQVKLDTAKGKKWLDITFDRAEVVRKPNN